MEVIQIPVLNDNYIYLIHGGGKTAVVDPAVAESVLKELKKQGWNLDYIINTHHHWDHVGANLELKNKTNAKILGYKGDKIRIPGIDIELTDDEMFNLCGEECKVMFVPGHTLGHIAYYFSQSGNLFCGDTLFSMGCGRLFEGTAEQMYNSLSKIKHLPVNTKIYCAHEYTEANARFARYIFPGNSNIEERYKVVHEMREADKSTIPVTLEMELKTNPFLLAGNVEEFAKYRKMKDGF